MRSDEKSNLTRLIVAAGKGDRQAFDRLVPEIYDAIRTLARAQRRKGWKSSPETTVLAHEAYLRMADHHDFDVESRRHFFAIVGRVIRQVLVDDARKRRAEKRGGDWKQTSLRPDAVGQEGRLEQLIALDEALSELEALDRRMTRVVELRFFSGLSEEETAAVLGLSARTVRRDWVRARAWLAGRLGEKGH